MSDERLRDSYDRFLTLRAGAAGNRDACIPIERLAGLVRREEDEASRLTLLDHVMACPFCQAEFEVLRVVARASGSETAPPVE
jgi:hypothetical protein